MAREQIEVGEDADGARPIVYYPRGDGEVGSGPLRRAAHFEWPCGQTATLGPAAGRRLLARLEALRACDRQAYLPLSVRVGVPRRQTYLLRIEGAAVIVYETYDWGLVARGRLRLRSLREAFGGGRS